MVRSPDLISTHSPWRGELFRRSLPKSLYSSAGSDCRTKAETTKKMNRFIAKDSCTLVGMTDLSSGCCCSRSLSFAHQRVDAPSARAAQKNIKENKAIHDCELTFVQVRNQTLRRVHHEKRHRHFAGGNERGESRQQTKRNEKSANDLHPAAHGHQRRKRFGFQCEGTEYLIEPMTGKHQTDDQTHDAIKRVRKSI